MSSHEHVAALIPVLGYKEKNFKFPWHDSLMPVGDQLTAVGRSVIECAHAGVETIWIIAEPNMQPLIRKNIGSLVKDPQTVLPHGVVSGGSLEHIVNIIPIYYISLDPTEIIRRGSYGWTIICGAVTAHKVCRRISSWVAPTKFFVSFPFGLGDPTLMMKKRGLLRKEENIFFKYQNKTIKDNMHLPFTFNYGDMLKIKKSIKLRSIISNPSIDSYDQGRYKCVNFNLSEVFDKLEIKENDQFVELDWFAELNSWESYVDYMRKDYPIMYRKHEYLNVREGKEYREIGEIEFEDEEEVEEETKQNVKKRTKN